MKGTTTLGLCVMAVLLMGASASSAALIMQYKAADYNTTAHTLVNAANPGTYDASMTWTPAQPALVTGQTPNGSSVLRFAYVGTAQSLGIASGPSLSSFTIFAYARPTSGTTGRRDLITTSTLGGVAYFLNAGKQGLNAYNSLARGTGTAALSTTSFSNISVTDSTTNGTFRLNGAADGTSTGYAFPASAPLAYIGGGTTGDWVLDIAEIRVYDTVLTDSERATIEGELNAAYVPEPTSVGLLCLGGLTLLRRRRLSRG